MKAGGHAASGLLFGPWCREIEVSDHFREVTKMITSGSGSNGKSRAICRIPVSSDLKSPIRCTCSQGHPLYFTETEAITPDRTKSLRIAHGIHDLQKHGMVKFVCTGGNKFAV